MQQHRVLQQQHVLLLLLRALHSTRRWWSTGIHPNKLVEQDCVSGGYWLLCV